MNSSVFFPGTLRTHHGLSAMKLGLFSEKHHKGIGRSNMYQPSEMIALS